VIKVYSEDFHWKLEKEVFVYELLRRHRVDAPVPEILAADDSKSLLPYNFSVMTKREGRHVLSLIEELSDRELEGINRQVGAILRNLHAVTFDEFGYMGASGIAEPHETNAAYMSVQFEKKIREFERLGGEDELRRTLEHYVADRAELLVACPRAVLCHDDCHEGNILVLPEDGWRISGLLDFENVVAGDPLLDLAKAHCYSRRPSEAKLDALVGGYGELRDGWRDAVDLYIVYHLLELWDWFAMTGHTEPLSDITGQLQRICVGAA
jgi:aminoglycoside phosphotransferase (APT) family kinase protein